MLKSLCALLLLFWINTYPNQKPHPKRATNRPSIRGTWQSLSYPANRIRFDDSLSYWYEGKELVYIRRYFLLKQCGTKQPIAYSSAAFIAFRYERDQAMECNELIANTAKSLGWMHETSGRLLSYKRVK